MINNIFASEFKICSLILIILAGKMDIVGYLLKYGLPFSGLKLISFDIAYEDLQGFWPRNL